MSARAHIYLSVPYRGTKEEIDERIRIVSDLFSWARKHGHFISSPVLHHYTFNSTEEANDNGDYWLEYSKQTMHMLAGVDNAQFWLLPLPGWEKSSGVAMELGIARALHMTMRVVNIEPNQNFVVHKLLWDEATRSWDFGDQLK